MLQSKNTYLESNKVTSILTGPSAQTLPHEVICYQNFSWKATLLQFDIFPQNHSGQLLSLWCLSIHFITGNSRKCPGLKQITQILFLDKKNPQGIFLQDSSPVNSIGEKKSYRCCLQFHVIVCSVGKKGLFNIKGNRRAPHKIAQRNSIRPQRWFKVLKRSNFFPSSIHCLNY